MNIVFFFFFKQKTAYELRISDWSSDVCSSDLAGDRFTGAHRRQRPPPLQQLAGRGLDRTARAGAARPARPTAGAGGGQLQRAAAGLRPLQRRPPRASGRPLCFPPRVPRFPRQAGGQHTPPTTTPTNTAPP